jgi:hypothetical protein
MLTPRRLPAFVSTWARALPAIGAACAALAIAPAQASALSASIDMPASVTVGEGGLTATVTLTNTSDLPATICNAGQCDSQGIIVVPSCGSADAAGTCKTPDLGVFSFASSSNATLGSCGLTTGFTVAEADPVQGTLRLTPVGAPVVLGAVQTVGATCQFSVPFGVLKQPATDTDTAAAGTQTLQSIAARAQVGLPGAQTIEDGAGRDSTTVLPRVPTQPPPAPVPPPVPPPPPAPAGLDHFKCYEALQTNFRRRLVGLRDQFGQRRSRVLRTRQLCNPVSKNQGPVLQPRAHLTCYETRDTNTRFVRRTVVVTNQFGQRKLQVLRPNRLCVPSLKRRTAGAVPTTPNPARLVDHFRCYDVQAQPAARTVTLRDQFKSTTAKVVRVVALCNPVRKNNEPVRRAKAHLVCYSITEAAFRPLAVRVRNQFGRAALRIRRPQTLCLPSFKEVVQTVAPASAPPGLDHFKCYEAEQPQFGPRFVGLRDQFGQSEGQVVATRQICNPVRKNNGRVLNPRAHLVCYETPSVGTVPFQPREVRVLNQFGIRQLSVVRPVTLCVPSLKRKGAGAAPTGPNPTLVLDHFRCYDIKPLSAPRTVKLVDQFRRPRRRSCGSCACATRCARTTRACGGRRPTSSATRSQRRRSSR